jgi:hypothetical protein
MTNETIIHAKSLLQELKLILDHERETNWIHGITSAIDCLKEEDESGFIAAKSIYDTMITAKSGFADYYIKRADCGDQITANRRLDAVRDELWRIFSRASN